MVRDEDGAAEAAGDATDDVDDADTEPAEQLLHVTHEQQLEDDTQQQLQNPAHHITSPRCTTQQLLLSFHGHYTGQPVLAGTPS